MKRSTLWVGQCYRYSYVYHLGYAPLHRDQQAIALVVGIGCAALLFCSRIACPFRVINVQRKQTSFPLLLPHRFHPCIGRDLRTLPLQEAQDGSRSRVVSLRNLGFLCQLPPLRDFNRSREESRINLFRAV